MRTVSLVNFKGGVGKTTLTANIAAGLACLGYMVLAIDLDPQANLTFSFARVDYWARYFEGRHTIKRWYEVLVRDRYTLPLTEIIVEPERPVGCGRGYLHLVPSHVRMFELDGELGRLLPSRPEEKGMAWGLSRLKAAIESLPESYYDVVLIDCPPAFNILTQQAVIASDYYIIPTKADYLSTTGLETLCGHVRTLIMRYNRWAAAEGLMASCPVFSGVVFNMVSKRSNEPIRVQASYIAKVRTQGLPVYSTVLRESKAIYSDAPEYGIPVILRRRSDETARQVGTELDDLVREFCERCLY